MLGGFESEREKLTDVDLVARRVRVQRDPVRLCTESKRRSAWFHRKAEKRAGVGSAWVAKRTVWQSSWVAMVETTGSEEG